MGISKRRILSNFSIGYLFAALILALHCLMLFGAPSVSAVSSFDNTVKTTNSLIAGETESSWVDLTNNYIAYGDSKCTSGSELSIWNRFKNAAVNYSDSRWAITQQTDGSNGGEQRYIEIAFTDNDSTTEWDYRAKTVPTVYNGLSLESASANGIQLIWLRSGTGSYDCTVVPDAGYVGGSRSDRDLPAFYANTFNIEFIEDYEGLSIPTGITPSIARGNALCAYSNDIPSAVQIDYSTGTDFNAILTDGPNASKNYAFTMWNESPYRVVVLCDGVPHYGPILEDDPFTLFNELYINQYGNYNWGCIEDQDQPYCYSI